MAFPIRVLHVHGARASNVNYGPVGMHPHRRPDALVDLDDPIYAPGSNAPGGPNLDELGPRSPGMAEPNDRILRALAEEVVWSSGCRWSAESMGRSRDRADRHARGIGRLVPSVRTWSG